MILDAFDNIVYIKKIMKGLKLLLHDYFWVYLPPPLKVIQIILQTGKMLVGQNDAGPTTHSFRRTMRDDGSF